MENASEIIGRLHNPSIYGIFIVGLIVIVGFYFGRLAKKLRLPAIIGYMIFGILLGPSILNLVTSDTQSHLSFITEVALGFVALAIGLELDIAQLKRHGKAIILIILSESFGAFIIVFAALYLLTKDVVLSLMFASVAPASAPAGTVAVIQEYKARGPLTNALYAVVGFDDGLGIIIFGFAFAIARSLLLKQAGVHAAGTFAILLKPFLEILMSFGLSIAFWALFTLLSRKLRTSGEVLVLVFGFVMLVTGLCEALGISLILTNMMIGILIVNTHSKRLIQHIQDELPNLMQIIFILFFTLAGTNLHIGALPSLGLIGLIYILSRAGGLMGGAWFGATIGKASQKIRKYLGLGILSQAGVAIGLSLIVKQQFAGVGKILGYVGGNPFTEGDRIGTALLTTITATCVVFEIVGPILTKIALTKAGEIGEVEQKTNVDSS